MIKVSKKVDEQFKKAVQIAIQRNPLEPYKWLRDANNLKITTWGEGFEELDNLTTEQLMLMYTIGYDVELNEIRNVKEVVYALVDDDNKLIGYDDSCELIYTTSEITDIRSNDCYFETHGLLEYINREYENGILAKSPELKFPLRVVQVNLDYKITEIKSK